MKMNIANEKQNPYMRRKEIILEIDHEAESTPSKAAIQELLAKQISADKEKVEIIDIVSETGRAKSKSIVFVWEEVQKKKEKKKEVEQKQEAIKTEVKEEQKAEEKKEAAKEEKAPKEEAKLEETKSS